VSQLFFGLDWSEELPNRCGGTPKAVLRRPLEFSYKLSNALFVVHTGREEKP
jgi:hypothetical protein